MRPEKATIVEELTAKLNQSPFLLITEYTGLRVDQFSELRRRLGEVGSECRVVKNTMLRIAAREVAYPDLDSALGGQVAIVVGQQDVCGAAKVLKAFAQEFSKPEIRSGVLDNAFLTREDVIKLAELPPLDVLRAQFLGLLQTPATQLARVLNEPGASLARILQAKLDAEGGSNA